MPSIPQVSGYTNHITSPDAQCITRTTHTGSIGSSLRQSNMCTTYSLPETPLVAIHVPVRAFQLRVSNLRASLVPPQTTIWNFMDGKLRSSSQSTMTVEVTDITQLVPENTSPTSWKPPPAMNIKKILKRPAFLTIMTSLHTRLRRPDPYPRKTSIQLYPYPVDYIPRTNWDFL